MYTLLKKQRYFCLSKKASYFFDTVLHFEKKYRLFLLIVAL
ncbi:hypothetical protein predicted by Glimmer/Critica [Lactiplantibacillus plantarum]|nr:hypothetical protein predicted by Glimmer/Critica [Lactiplantibacillus plantarum]